MKVTRSYPSFSDAYNNVLNDIFFNYDYYLVGNKTRFNDADAIEKVDYSFIIINPQPGVPQTISDKRNEIMERYSSNEVPLFDSGNNNSDGQMATLSKVWDSIKNPDGTINANYGLMVYHTRDAGDPRFVGDDKKLTQWEWAKMRLIDEPTTCQAISFLCRPTHQWKGNHDVPCTVFIQFMIRDNKLNLLTYMRSNDLIYGTPYNINYFILLQHRMLEELRHEEQFTTLELGTLTHHASSLHIYKKHFSKVRDMLGLADDVQPTRNPTL